MNARASAAWPVALDWADLWQDNRSEQFKSKVHKTVVGCRVLALDQENWKSLQCNGNKDATVDGQSNTTGLRSQQTTRQNFRVAPTSELCEALLRWRDIVIRANNDDVCRTGLNLKIHLKQRGARPKQVGWIRCIWTRRQLAFKRLIKRTNVTTPVELTRHRANQALIIIMTTTTVSAD